MSAALAWLVPIFCSIGLLVVLANLGKSAKKLSRQTNRFDKQLAAFIGTDHQGSKTVVPTKQLAPEEASANRRSYLKQRTKNKSDRQRRLVKRLRTLKSKESE